MIKDVVLTVVFMGVIYAMLTIADRARRGEQVLPELPEGVYIPGISDTPEPETSPGMQALYAIIGLAAFAGVATLVYLAIKRPERLLAARDWVAERVERIIDTLSATAVDLDAKKEEAKAAEVPEWKKKKVVKNASRRIGETLELLRKKASMIGKQAITRPVSFAFLQERLNKLNKEGIIDHPGFPVDLYGKVMEQLQAGRDHFSKGPTRPEDDEKVFKKDGPLGGFDQNLQDLQNAIEINEDP